MTKAERKLIIESAVRWASNMLVEVNGNHGHILGDSDRCLLSDAVYLLGQFGRPAAERKAEGK